MPAAIPVIFAAIEAAPILAGTAALTLASGAIIAGGVLAGVGALSGNQSLSKIGGVLSLVGGGIKAFDALAAKTGAEVAGAEAADKAAQTVADKAGATIEGIKGGETIAEASGATGLNSLAESGVNLDGFSQVANDAAGNLSGEVFGGVTDSFGASGMSEENGLISRAMNPAGTTLDQMQAAMNPLGEVDDLAGGLKSVGAAPEEGFKGLIGKVGRFAKDNKELLSLGGNMLSGMYGPNAETAELRKKLFEWEKAQREQQLQNLNYIPVIRPTGAR